MIEGIDYIKLNDEDLKKLHEEMLQLLIEVDKICKKNNIPYFLAGGTLLGAIRHKGFIPWDDDIDIHMFRKDYEQFCEICKKELNKDRYFLQNQCTDEHYNWVYGKLRLKNTSFIRAGQEHIKQKDGIFIDICPIDNLTSGEYKQKLTTLICKMCRKLLWAQVGKKNAGTVCSRVLFKVLSLIPRTLTITIFNYFSSIYNKKETPFLVCHNVAGHIYRREWYDETILVEFEGLKFQAPKGYDDILSSMYGEYMKLPPIEKRKGHIYASYIKFLDGGELKL
ncbi:LicD family protein [Paenibacillus sp. MER 180]|uniref:LicD family protein n=1 Tax=Paenibacillus sp. MER 180 TaxID=2939570 RepID=UPI00203BAB6A|nr:LicD family protein [Paenibacillus sp. MER 180]MCM3292249.1 LicD family protein [Paenibacillus sp. MER 180]